MYKIKPNMKSGADPGYCVGGWNSGLGRGRGEPPSPSINNKRPMGHITHLRKTVQINKHIWLYHNVDQGRSLLKFPVSRICWEVFFLGFKSAQWLWRRGFFNVGNVFSLSHNYLSLEKGGALHLNKVESPSPKDDLCQIWLKLVLWF